MEQAEYDAMYRLEDSMWWYGGLRLLVCDLITGAGMRSGPLLDVGCGTGGMLRVLCERFGDQLCAGLEYDPGAARLAASKSGAPVATASIHALPLGTGTAVALTCLDVLPHAAVDPPLALKELQRCLGSGGILVLNVPAYRWMLSAHDRRVHNVRRFGRGELQAMLSQAGLRVVRIGHWNSFLFPLMALRRLLARADTGSDVRPYPALLNRLFLAIIGFERWLIRRGVDLPFGGSIVAVAVKD